MNLFFAHLNAHFWDFVRQPTYIVTSILFPSMFFLFFGVPNIYDQEGAVILTGSFAAFGVIGVCFFQFSVTTAVQRNSSWSVYQKLLPVHPSIILASKAMLSLVLAALTVACVVACALLATELTLSSQAWLKFIGVLYFGCFPFLACGLALGYWTNGRNALPIANMFYLPMSFVGGLWLPPNILPKQIRPLSEYLPTRHYGELVWKAGLDQELQLKYFVYLGLLTIVAWGFALWAIRRENQRVFS